MGKSDIDLDRRHDCRLPGGGTITACLVGAGGTAGAPLAEPLIDNISAGGMAISTSTVVGVGAKLRILPAHERTGCCSKRAVTVEVLSASKAAGGRCVLRCRVTEGVVPAELMFGLGRFDASPAPAKAQGKRERA